MSIHYEHPMAHTDGAGQDDDDCDYTYITWACENGYHGGCRGSVCDCGCHPHDGTGPFSSEQASAAENDDE